MVEANVQTGAVAASEVPDEAAKILPVEAPTIIISQISQIQTRGILQIVTTPNLTKRDPEPHLMSPMTRAPGTGRTGRLRPTAATPSTAAGSTSLPPEKPER